MTTFILILSAILILALVYLASLEGVYHVDRHLVIQAPVDKVYATVKDFMTWPKWSPWLLHEPNTQLEYSAHYDQVDGFYTWDGQLVGAGKLTHIEFRENTAIHQRIEFSRPFKSTNHVSWTFSVHEQGTEVHWIMDGKMPFLFRFMTRMTAMMIAKDYDLGLHLLNGYLNPRASFPRYHFDGEENLKGFYYARKAFKGLLPDLIQFMKKAFPPLTETVKNKGIINGFPLAIYHKADPIKKYFECDIAVPITQQLVDTGLDYAYFPGGNYYKVTCMGDYRFLELSWYKAYSHVRMLKLKIDRKRPSLEVYENDSGEVENINDLKTSLYLPVK